MDDSKCTSHENILKFNNIFQQDNAKSQKIIAFLYIHINYISAIQNVNAKFDHHCISKCTLAQRTKQ